MSLVITIIFSTGVPVYIHDELYQKVMRVSNNAAALGQDVVTCYTPHT